MENTFSKKTNLEVEGGKKKSRQAQNLAIIKKSTILIQSGWNSSNI